MKSMKWYTIPAFQNAVPLYLYHKEQDGAAEEELLQKRLPVKNLHVLARAGFCMEEKPGGKDTGKKDTGETYAGETDTGKMALLRITADDYYKLYVNGQFVGQGPAPAWPEHYYYNEYDLSGILRPGNNVIAVHLYYQGLVNRVWNSGDNRFGVAAELRIIKEDGEREIPLTWKYRQSGAWSGETTGYETQFLENFDSRLWEEDWNLPETTEEGWENMAEASWADYRLEPQPTKPLSVYEIQPKEVRKISRFHWQIDIGQEIAGSLFLEARGHEGDRAEIRCGEELTPEGRVRCEMRCGCSYRETWTLRDGVSSYEPYDYKGFRYIELCGEESVEFLSCRIQARHYPLDESLCTLEMEGARRRRSSVCVRIR